jgi:pimeloyl-ACP methyl ester carboxylesterase
LLEGKTTKMNIANSYISNDGNAGLQQTALERRKAGRFAETSGIHIVRKAFGLLCKASPGIAARIAYALLSKPPRTQERPWQVDLRQRARTSTIRHTSGSLKVHEWGAGPVVLLVHGWGARATHMGKLIEPLVDAGYRVVSFDAPAHGDSTGSNTDLMEFASAVDTVARFAGPVDTLIAHSFGVSMALFARRDWGVEAKRQVFISSFDHCKWFTNAFANYVGLSAGVIEQARQLMVERYWGRLDWDRLSVVEMLRRTEEPTLIVHDTEDPEIPYEHGLALVQAAPHAQIHTTSGLGHHRLLGSPAVIQRVLSFLKTKQASYEPA